MHYWCLQVTVNTEQVFLELFNEVHHYASIFTKTHSSCFFHIVKEIECSVKAHTRKWQCVSKVSLYNLDCCHRGSLENVK